MAGFNIFNPQFEIDKYTTVTVSDGYHSFRLILAYMGDYAADITAPRQPIFTLFWPDYSAEAFGDVVNYRITIHHWDNTVKVIDVDAILNPADSVACAPFRFEANEYNQMQPINWKIDLDGPTSLYTPKPDRDWYYVSIKPWIINDGVDISEHEGLYAEDGKTLYLDEVGRPNREYIGSQNAFDLLNDFNISLDTSMERPEGCAEYSSSIPNVFNDKLVIRFYRDGENMSINTLKEDIEEMYSTRFGDNINVDVIASLYIADEEHVYAKTAESAAISIDEEGRLTCDPPKGEPWYRLIYNPNTKQLSETNDNVLPEWYDSMRIFGWVKFRHYDEDGDPVDLIGYKTNMVPVTQDMWAYWCANDKSKIEGNFKMSNFPRTINKTIQQVTNISATTDSKAGIVQPVFVRVRDLANIVIHPAVTENICINLDAYKSSVKKFMLQIEGCTFAESGRTAGGVVFKVVGNKLSGELALGTYYVLNQDSEVVTSGRYQYEY